MMPRPDELALQGDINRSKEINRNVSGAVSTAAGLGLGTLGAGLSSKILPFLNDYIPASLALKGIQKVAPKFGQALSNGVEQGLDLKEGLNYLKDAFSNSEKKTTLEKYSPEMFQAIKEFVKSTGKSPRMAILHFLQRNPSYKDIVKKMEKDVGKDMFDIAEEAFKTSPSQQQTNQMPQQGQQLPQQIPQAQQGQQSSGVDQALLAAFDKIMKM